MRSMVELAEKFQPDVALTDYEFFVPRVCRQLGIPCLSLDHQHLITLASFSTPLHQCWIRMMAALSVKRLFSEASAYLVTSFFQPPPLSPNVVIAPPLLRESVLRHQPQDGEHVVAYQGYETFSCFLPFLRNIKSPVFVYGLSTPHQDGNLTFKAYSEEEFLKNLASCRYVVCGGGHSLISEALFYGKPVLSFPIKNAFEQFLNAYYVEKLGYGKMADTHRPSLQMLEGFESRLDFFRANIKKENFCGNDEIFRLLDRFIATGRLLTH
ncbi:MAG: glycosyltransferase family protein [bacterium]